MSAPPIAERHLPHFHRRAPMKEPVRAATTANITISTALNNGDSLDGVTLATDDRVLVKNQSTASQNGIYVVGASPTRDYDESSDDPSFGWLVYVREGTTNGGTLWANTNTSAPTIDTTALTFAQFTGSGAPTSADYLVGTANGSLSAEIVVGTTPGGELGGTWGSPTVDGTHSGSAHTDFIAKAIVDAKGDIIAATAADTVARVAVGTDGQFLKADSGASAGVSWATASGSGTLTTVEEVDGSPTDSAVTKLVFPNGTLSIASHVATYTPSGGGGPSDYVSGASGTGHIVIPGLAGSVDIPPGGGSDDEFDGSLGAWTAFGSPTTANANTARLSHLYLKKNAASGANVAGEFKANPSMPFTMTAKLSDLGLYGSFNMAGIFVGVANPAAGAFKACLFQVNGIAGQYNPGVIAWTNPTTYNGGGTYAADYAGILPIYLRIVAASSTDVTFSYSYGGRFYTPIVSNNNPGFTIGSVGLFVNPDSASNPAEADFDWIRFV